MKLLIIEDETAISTPLKTALEKRKYAVDTADTGEEGYSKASLNQYDCILLDLNLPEMDGIEVAKRLRREGSKTPILMLTARSNRENIYEGFESGTDDYLTKPFDFKELLFRIEALIKRNTIDTGIVLEVADLQLNTRTLKVTKAGFETHLNAKEYGILEYLLRNRGRIVNQEELLEHVWNEEVDLFTQTVRTNIKTLRKKVDPNKDLIRTYKGKGYVID